MGTALNIVQQITDSIASQVGSSISGVIQQISSAIQNTVVNPVSNDISGALGAIGSGLDTLETNAKTAINGTISSVGATLQNVEQSAVNGFNSTLTSVEQVFQALSTEISQAISQLVTGVEQGFNAIEQGVNGAIEEVGTVIGEAVGQLQLVLQSVITNILTPFVTFIEGLPQDIETIAGKVADALGDVAKGIEDGATQALSIATKDFDIADKWVTTITDPATWVGPKQLFGSAIFDIIAGITGLDLSKADPLAIGRLGIAFDVLFTIGLSADVLEGFLYVLGTNAPKLMETALIGSWRDLEQMANAGVPNVLLRPTELLSARFKNTIDDNYFYDQMERHGISDKNADVMFDTALQKAGLSDLVTLFRRGILTSIDDFHVRAKQVQYDTEQADFANTLYDTLLALAEQIELWRRNILPDGWTDFFDDAVANGYTPERLDALKAISFRIPTPTEQKRFTIRQVDDPTIVAKYGYDTGLDQAYLDAARANGYDEDTAKRLFRDSWAVPPLFISEGLYRSGLLDKETFTEFLELEGYTPYFSDKLISQLAPKLSLGDIKDLYKFQVITAEQIPENLAPLGITGSLASQYQELWTASVKLAAPHEGTAAAAAAEKVKNETEALIKTAFKDGILTKDQAMTQLETLDYTSDAANLIIEIAEYEVTAQAIKDEYTIVESQYLAGQIDINAAMQSLITAGASNTQVAVYQAKLQKTGQTKPKIPTLAEFASFYKKGIIDVSTFASAISFLGYSDTWVPFFLLDYGAAAADVEALGYSLTIPSV